MLFVIAIGALALAHVLRAIRHSALFPADSRPRTFHLAVGLSIGYVIDTLAPFRIGELVRAIYVSRRGGLNAGAVLATVIFERLTDLVAVVLILLIMPHVAKGEPAPASALFLMATGAVGITAIALAIRVSHSARRLIWIAASLFNNRIRIALVDAAWSLVRLVSSNPARFRFYWLATAPMWGTYLCAYALLGEATGVGTGTVTNSLLARPLSAMLGATRFERDLLLVAGVSALAILLVGLIADGSGIQSAFRRMLRAGLPEADVSALMSRSTFARDEDYAAVLGAHFTDTKSATAGFGVHGLAGAVVERLLPGGSDAVTAVVRADGRRGIRKFAIGHGAVKLAEQADWLREHRAGLPVAEIIAEHPGVERHGFDMPFFTSAQGLYETVHTIPVESSRRLLHEIIDRVDNWHQTHLQGQCSLEALEAYVDQKVVANAMAALAFARERLPERYTINGDAYRLAEWDPLLDRRWVIGQLNERAVGAVHGDLTIENIIVCPDRRPGWYLIDPNPNNLFNTPLIDWAKLSQSLNLGYESLNRGGPAQIQDGAIRMMFDRSRVYVELHEELRREMGRRLRPQARREVEFHEIVNYLRLIPYKLRRHPSKAMTFFACASVLLREYETVCVG